MSYSEVMQANSVEFAVDALVIHLDDGRSLSVPLDLFPKLRDARPEQRENWRLIGQGIGINWPDLDEDLSVGALLGLSC
jgi:hypothetical protein